MVANLDITPRTAPPLLEEDLEKHSARPCSHMSYKLDLSRRLTTPEQAKKDTQFWNLAGQRLGINESSLEENRLDQIIQEEYEKLLQEHAKEYVWGVKAPYHRTANQYELSVLNHDILKEKGKHHDMACG